MNNKETKEAIKLLKKQQPKLVNKDIWGASKCPNCGHMFNPYQYGDKYCSKCGQRLEWA